MRFPQNWKVPVAAHNRGRFDLSNDVVTTADVFNVKPFLSSEVVPGDKWNIKTETFTRLAPMVVPTFGRMDIVNRFFFVPYRTLIDDWYNFINNQENDFGSEVSLPLTNLADLALMFFDSGAGAGGDGMLAKQIHIYTYARTQESDPVKTPHDILDEDTYGYDFFDYSFDDSSEVYIDETEVTTYKFTDLGKRFYDILLSLGYQFSWDTNTSNQPSVSSLPFISFVKVLSDFYCPTNFNNPLVELCARYKSRYIESIVDLSIDEIYYIVNSVPYNSDYFTSSWQSPVAPNSSVGDLPVSINDGSIPSSSGNVITDGTDGTPFIDADSDPAGPPVAITKFALNALDALQSYLVRNNLTGYRPIDRLLARYGIKLDYKQTNRALYLGSDSAPVQISDIMATADTYDGSTGAVLGDYAGKGISFNNNGNIEFKADEFGLILGISTIVPKVGYVQGIDRQLLHINPLDFFVPEFEHLGTQAIMRGELYNDFDMYDFARFAAPAAQYYPIDGVFSFSPRYSEYKMAKDKLTGDFRVHSLNDDTMNGYHLFRMFGNKWQTDQAFLDDMTFNRNFLFAQREQFNRIFNDDGSVGNLDHFLQIFHNEVHVERNMESLTESLFDDHDKKDHRTIDVRANGSFNN